MGLLELAALVLVFNALTFGNGPTMVPLLQRSLVEARQVIDVDQLLYAFAIARVVPGQANVYVAAIGWMLFGLPGALLATLAIQLPGYLMLPLLRGYERLRRRRPLEGGRGLHPRADGRLHRADLRGRGGHRAPLPGRLDLRGHLPADPGAAAPGEAGTHPQPLPGRRRGRGAEAAARLTSQPPPAARMQIAARGFPSCAAGPYIW